MTTPIFPSVIGHNLLDGGTDAQDGNRYPGPLLQEYAAAVVGAAALSQESTPADLPWLAARSPGAYTQVSLPSPYSPGHVLHPSIAYFPNGWRGYNYWCAYTPYPNSDSVFENPCVAASKDGNAWVPIGPQPVFPRPSLSTYNSDTDLVYDAPNDRLIMLYRVSGDSINRLYISTSADGANWSVPVQIWQGSAAGFTDLASPSLWYNSTSGRWEIVGHNIAASGGAWVFSKITSPNLLSGWDTALTTLTFTPPSGRKWWHSQFRRLSSGVIVGIVQDNDGTGGAPGNLYSAYSADGTNFSSSALDTTQPNTAKWYRPSFAIRYDSVRGEWVADLFVSKLSSATLFRARLAFEKGAELFGYPTQLTALLAGAAIPPRNAAVIDTCVRADSAVALGTATSGVAWTPVSGDGALGIVSNKAYNVTTSNSRATVDAGGSDYIATMRIATRSASAYLIGRFVDSNNFIRIGITGPGSLLLVQVVTGGSIAATTSLQVTPQDGDQITVRFVGAQITVWINDIEMVTVVSTQGLSAQLVGIQMSGALGGRVDKIAVLKL